MNSPPGIRIILSTGSVENWILFAPSKMKSNPIEKGKKNFFILFRTQLFFCFVINSFSGLFFHKIIGNTKNRFRGTKKENPIGT